ncbi:MAG: hypothetical protein JXQ73_20675 [Phycisphaerae bacterium]|nr:hypothetical protein [Phycisphaerae bacterium]
MNCTVEETDRRDGGPIRDHAVFRPRWVRPRGSAREPDRSTSEPRTEPGMTAMRSRSASVAAALACLLPATAAWACKYTVRDVGFIDLGATVYRACLITGDDTPKAWLELIEQASYVTLLDSNVRFEIVNADRDKGHDAVARLSELGITSLPALVLLSPEGKALRLAEGLPTKTDRQAAWALLERAVVSPLRGEIVKVLPEAYCLVLLIDGSDAKQNERAAAAVQATVKEITGAMDQLPKEIKNPPGMIRLPSERRSQEGVLLWSLGLETGVLEEPAVVVLYGRGRWIGPKFRGAGIVQGSLTDLVALVGASCECGLDRRQMLGVMVPLRWDEATQTASVKNLGFDPENPMVKMEVSQILAMSSSGGGQAAPGGTGLIGYREQVVEFTSDAAESERTRLVEEPIEGREAPASQGAGAAPQLRSTTMPARSVAAMGKTDSDDDIDASGGGVETAWLVGGGLALIIVAGGVYIILRAQRRAA